MGVGRTPPRNFSTFAQLLRGGCGVQSAGAPFPHVCRTNRRAICSGLPGHTRVKRSGLGKSRHLGVRAGCRGAAWIVFPTHLLSPPPGCARYLRARPSGGIGAGLCASQKSLAALLTHPHTQARPQLGLRAARARRYSGRRRRRRGIAGRVRPKPAARSAKSPRGRGARAVPPRDWPKPAPRPPLIGRRSNSVSRRQTGSSSRDRGLGWRRVRLGWSGWSLRS